MNQKQLVVAIVGAVFVVNLIGFAVFMKGRAAAAEQASVRAAMAPVPPPVDTAALERDQLARARRAAGVAALEAGDYDRALINFTEAQALVGAAAKVEDLLKITEDLRTRAAARTDEGPRVDQPAKPMAFAKSAPTRPSSRLGAVTPARVVAAVNRPAEARPTEALAPIITGTGMLLVSTTPRGLLVQLDGAPMDLTPMRAPVKVGSHRVALFDGDRKVYDTTVDITEGNVAMVLKDLSIEVAPKEAARVEPKPVEVVARVEPKPSETPAARAVEKPAPVAVPEPVASAKSGVAISAPGVYGEVWLNGRPVGFAPVTVEDLKPGLVKIEVRVNGVVKRSTTALVEAGQIKPVRVIR